MFASIRFIPANNRSSNLTIACLNITGSNCVNSIFSLNRFVLRGTIKDKEHEIGNHVLDLTRFNAQRRALLAGVKVSPF